MDGDRPVSTERAAVRRDLRPTVDARHRAGSDSTSCDRRRCATLGGAPVRTRRTPRRAAGDRGRRSRSCRAATWCCSTSPRAREQLNHRLRWLREETQDPRGDPGPDHRLEDLRQQWPAGELHVSTDDGLRRRLRPAAARCPYRDPAGGRAGAARLAAAADDELELRMLRFDRVEHHYLELDTTSMLAVLAGRHRRAGGDRSIATSAPSPRTTCSSTSTRRGTHRSSGPRSTRGSRTRA